MVLALGCAVSWSMTKRKKPTHHLTDEDYQTLAAFRTALRRFTHFSETAAKSAGLTPQQHQALLAIRAAKGAAISIGELAEYLVIQPHSASELADRLVVLGLVSRKPDARDRRIMKLCLTQTAEAALLTLSVTHRDELRALRPLLIELLAKLD
jgi:DNA-binding MarR family transcriptional regulator